MASPAERRVRLRTKLVIGLIAVILVKLAFLAAYFAPHAERSFTAHSSSLIELSAHEMKLLAREDTETGREILQDVVRHNLDARRRTLLDLPLSLYEGDVERIRTAVVEQDERRAVRMQRNIEVLTREMDRRADTRIDAHADGLRDSQLGLVAQFGSEIRWSYLLVVGLVFAALVVLLGIGLDRAVVAPLHELRHATRAVAGGDLSVDVEVASGDEVGELASDFREMVAQLRVSREEIERKNEELRRSSEGLEEEVARKTRHLEDALADLQKTQNQLLRADRMASIGTLAGGIAHEFNNLIGGIRGCVVDALQDERDGERRELLDVVLRATDRARVVTDKLLSFARPRMAGRERIGVAELVGEVLDLVEPQARRQGVEVVRVIPIDLAARVDAGEMHQVFLNLFTNALQSMPDGGRLTVDARRTDGELTVRVSDTGVGISAEEIEHVFDPFHSSKDRDSDPFRRGTGLGLSVSYGIVEAHGGTIRVASERGRGSTFTVRVPFGGEGDDA